MISGFVSNFQNLASFPEDQLFTSQHTCATYVFQCWVAAAVEVFLTWGLLGAAVMQISSHNQQKHLLNRDTSLVVVVTIAVLLLTAFLANTCITILHSHGFVYVPSSFGKLHIVTLLDTDCNKVQFFLRFRSSM